MEKIESFQFVLDYLKNKEVVITKNKTSFSLLDGKISVHTKNCHYSITIDEFKELFSKEEFYLYTNIQSSIDEEKDADYYSWKNKGVN